MVTITIGAWGARRPRRVNWAFSALSSLFSRKPEMSKASARAAASPMRLPARIARHGKVAKFTAASP